MAESAVDCAGCGRKVRRSNSEINRSRKLGRKIFCSGSCSATSSNAPRRSVEIEKTCPCGAKFKTTTRRRAPDHCSPAHATQFNPTARRKEAQRESGLQHTHNLFEPQRVLQQRERWKYARLEPVLADTPHEFEFKLDPFVFDLALIEHKILVEFDGRYHTGTKQRAVDQAKDAHAAAAGFTVHRVQVPSAAEIDPEVLRAILG